jgi:hypothetical protein
MNENQGRLERRLALPKTLFVGYVWGKLTIEKIEGRHYFVKCACGNVFQIRHCHLPSRSSCGCRAHQAKEQKVHEHKHYHRWINIKMRIFNTTNKAYPNYGGRGIRLHDAWVSDFYAFADAIGEPPTPLHELDRIDNDGHYEPGNLRWVRRTANIRNTRNACKIVIDDVKVPLAVACFVAKIDYYCAHGAYKKSNDHLLKYFVKKGADLLAIKDHATKNDLYDSDVLPIYNHNA